MPEPWFNPNLYAWIPGTVYGVAGGLLGGLAGTLAPQGKARSLVVGSFYTMIGISILLLIVGVAAYFSGQPYGIWYGLGLPGVLGVILFPSLLPVIHRRYREAEERSMKAQDME